MRKIIIIQSVSFFILLFTASLKAQQLPHYTQYLYNMQVINPAFVGARAELSMSLLSRQQWFGVEGAPQTNTFSINGRLQKGLGLGLTFINDNIGFSKTNTVNVDASVTLITSEYSRLSFGLKGGVTFFNNNYTNAITPDNDVYNGESGEFFNLGFGAFFQTRRFFVGLSVPYILETPQFYLDTNFENNSISKNLNVFFSGGLLFEVSESILFKPTTMVRYTANLPLSVDVNANFLYDNRLELGLSYRHQSSISGLFAIILNEKFRIGYSYDHKITEIGSDFNSHEIVLQLDLDFFRNNRWLEPNRCYF